MRFLKTIKFRLTIWYVVVVGVLLLLFSAGAYTLLSNRLYSALDDSLKLRATDIQNSLNNDEFQLDIQDPDRVDLQQQWDEVILVYDSDGHLADSTGPKVEIPQASDLVHTALRGYFSLVYVKLSDKQNMRVYASPLRYDGDIQGAVIVGRYTEDIDRVLARFRDVLMVAVSVAVVLAGAGGLFLANQAFKPVKKITETAQGIQESDLSKRIEVHSDDELGRLASTLNQMIERLEKAFERQRQFTADASHELRTPLAIIEAESTLSLRKERTEDDYQKSLDLISQEVSYMSATLNNLLMLARADAGKEQLNFENVNLTEFLNSLAQDVDILCREKDVSFQLEAQEDVVIRADSVRMRQLFLNLLDNAMRYTPQGGNISVSLSKRGKNAVVTVADTGIGIAEEHLPHIFDRFYRVDKARSRSEKGTGLGLSICKYIVETHGGSIGVDSRVGKGTTFTVVLPLIDKGGEVPPHSRHH